jgi:ADP-heptose:LPS heptosyltransferase
VLQRGSERDEAAACGLTLAEEGDALTTARTLTSLDLVITIDTMVAHLAGALGVPVWTMLHSSPDWRWLEARDDSPWYGSMRLFRQHHAGVWSDVVLRLRAELQRWSCSAETGPRNWRSTIASHAAP